MSGGAPPFARLDRFMALSGGPDALWTLFGIPMDFTASFQPGSRFAPPRIREASYGLETYSPPLDRDLVGCDVEDLGDLELPIGNVKASLDHIEEAASALVERGRRFIALGGEHLVTLPLIRAVHRRYPDLLVVHWDAHADLREDYLGEPLSHAAVIRRVSEVVGSGRVYQFGIRSATQDEMVYARAHTRLHPEAVLEPLREVLDELRGRPVYFTLDVDVIDPAFMPGTGTPEPGGITAREALDAVRALEGLDLVGADIVETMPLQDISQRSALLAAKLVRELVLVTAGRPEGGEGDGG
jgi:agmatinase